MEKRDVAEMCHIILQREMWIKLDTNFSDKEREMLQPKKAVLVLGDEQFW